MLEFSSCPCVRARLCACEVIDTICHTSCITLSITIFLIHLHHARLGCKHSSSYNMTIIIITGTITIINKHTTIINKRTTRTLVAEFTAQAGLMLDDVPRACWPRTVCFENHITNPKNDNSIAFMAQACACWVLMRPSCGCRKRERPHRMDRSSLSKPGRFTRGRRWRMTMTRRIIRRMVSRHMS